MKKMKLPVLFFSTLFFALCSGIYAQGLKPEEIKAQMIKDWERSKTYTIDYLNTMPADKYSFRAHDSIRSFAQQMLHLAQGNLFLMSNATDQAPPSFLMTNLENSAGAVKKDSVMYYVSASYDYCINAIKSVDVTKWNEKKKIFGFEETRWALMMKTFEHQGHHRSNATIYIRLQGIRPPGERLF